MAAAVRTHLPQLQCLLSVYLQFWPWLKCNVRAVQLDAVHCSSRHLHHVKFRLKQHLNWLFFSFDSSLQGSLARWWRGCWLRRSLSSKLLSRLWKVSRQYKYSTVPTMNPFISGTQANWQAAPWVRNQQVVRGQKSQFLIRKQTKTRFVGNTGRRESWPPQKAQCQCKVNYIKAGFFFLNGAALMRILWRRNKHSGENC